MKRLILSLIAGAAFITNAQSENTESSAPNLDKMSYREANDVISAEIRAFTMHQEAISKRYIDTMVVELQQAGLSKEKRVLIIYFLGQLRLDQTNVVEVLIENIDLKVDRLEPATDMRRWGNYPAEEALIKIGEPAVEPILDRLPNESSELRRKLMCNVIRQVLRRDFRSVTNTKL